MRDTGTWYCAGLTTVGDTVGGCGLGGGKRRGLVTTYEVGVGGGYGLV